jgi:hypothetical protein
VVAGTLVGLWLAAGVNVSEIARFAAYEGVLVGLPGILAYRALSPAPGGTLQQIAIGWPLGYAIEIGAFVLTAALGLRGLFPALPLGVAAIAGVYLWRARPSPQNRAASAKPEDGGPLLPAAVWTVTAVVVVALGYLALGYFTATPLPGEVSSVSYPADTACDIGLIAEAKNHWPLQDPSVAGVPLRYHVYGFIDMASVSQVTGIEPAVLVLRLVPASLFVLLALGVVAIGRRLGRSPWIGPLAAALVLLVGELDLDPERASPIGNNFFENLYLSPTFLFGVPLFLAVTALLLEFLASRRRPRLREWILLAVLLFACGGAKASILPVLLGGLVLWIAWSWWRERGLSRNAVVATALALAGFLVSYALLYSGSGGRGFSLGIFGFTDYTVVDQLISPSGWLGDAALTMVSGVLGAVAIVLPALGILWVIRARPGLDSGQAWLLALFLTSLVGFCFVSQPGLSQAYILHYGYIAGCVLSAQGILLFLARHRPEWKRPRATLAALLCVALAGGVIAAAAIYQRGPGEAGLGRLALGYGIAALVICALALWAGRSARGRMTSSVAGFGAGVALLLTISIGLLNTPLDVGVPVVDKLKAGEKLYPPDDPALSRGLSPGLYVGLRWVRDHSGKDDVIAVNNHSLDAGGLDSRYFYYTAFTERRAFLESWLYTPEAQKLGYDRVANGEVTAYPARQALNRAVFDTADAGALRELRDDYGVDLLLVDRRHGTATPSLRRIAQPVFENSALIVYRVPPIYPRPSSIADPSRG